MFGGKFSSATAKGQRIVFNNFEGCFEMPTADANTGAKFASFVDQNQPTQWHRKGREDLH
jgi:hypothetical protein